MPTNLYGEGDNYHEENSHVLPALLQRFHSHKLANKNLLYCWGSGEPRREFMHVNDLAEASIFALEKSQEKELIKENISKNKKIESETKTSIGDLIQEELEDSPKD